MSTAKIPFPLFTIVVAEAEVMFCRTPEGPAMTLFASEEDLKLFAERTYPPEASVGICRIDKPSQLAAVLRKPTQKPVRIDDFIVLMDPVDATIGEYLGFNRDGMLQELERLGN